ncbi:NnrS family protein [Methylophilus aquaticus]|uniref:NnrS family protein n=1 Tax=Methylophilus aquaticus TaxID=1971610 RepID=A0ABT9JTG6_9PROT|nr:NnrS family protein [Methylophilus aquaticus]MDP8567415.1 NnrS family protein [Methylophilus aquaticus]
MQSPVHISPPGKKLPDNQYALFNLGFRPFFLLAAAFAVIAIALWSWKYTQLSSLSLSTVTASQWHAHEMLYGFAFAVIAGFLLTAVKNWTGIQTLHGRPLMALVACWAMARCVMLIAPDQVLIAAGFDLCFNLWLIAAVAQPVIKVKQWRQLGVLSKVILLTIGNAAFYAQATGLANNGAHAALWMGLLLNVSLIMVISRRILPMFIERGVKEEVSLKNAHWIDRLLMVALVALLINILTLDAEKANVVLGLTIALLSSFRLWRWHTPGIWRVPLLWSFYCGLWLMNAGFFIYALSFLNPGMSQILAIHCWAIGGIGVITLAMMARVSLGHTGRNIHTPPRSVHWIFGLIMLSALCRVLLPLIHPEIYRLSVMLAATCWIAAFALFCVTYWPILSQPRTDGMAG